jgi:hypothetical protein
MRVCRLTPSDNTFRIVRNLSKGRCLMAPMMTVNHASDEPPYETAGD